MAGNIDKPKSKDVDAKIEAEVKARLAKEEAEEKAAEEKKTKQTQAQAVAPKNQSDDPWKPVRLASKFIGGEVEGTLNGISSGGRLGLWAALLATLAVGVGAGMSAIPMFAIIYGPAIILTGIALGGAFGAVTGGIRGLTKKERGDPDYVEAQGAKKDNFLGVDYRDIRAERREVADINFDRIQQQGRENARDESTYWRDQVTNSPNTGWAKGVF